MDEGISVESSIWGRKQFLQVPPGGGGAEQKATAGLGLCVWALWSVGLQDWTLSPIFQSTLGPCLAHPHLL